MPRSSPSKENRPFQCSQIRDRLAANVLQQQARFDKFIDIFNNERPHEPLVMKRPAKVYQPSPRLYNGSPDIDYPSTTKPS